MQWTKEQREAIDARDTHLLLSAAAGSGKTTVLVERVQSLIRNGADIGNMLIVTFTRAAAADMRAALIKALEKTAQENPDEPRYREQAEAAEYAGISTIHSFCIDLLRDHFQKAEVDPAFRVADTAEGTILCEKALDEAMNTAYAADSDDLRVLSDGRKPETVRKLVLQLYNFIMERPEPWVWLDDAIEALEKGEDRWSDVLLNAARRIIKDARALAEYMRSVFGRNDALAFLNQVMEADCGLLDELLSLDYESLRQALDGVSFVNLPKGKKVTVPADDPDYVAYKNMRKEMKDIVDKAQKKLTLPLGEALSDLPESAREMRALRDIVRRLDEGYTRLKNERSLLTFGDLERRAMKALKDESVVAALRERYTHIFVDEYQDVSEIQETILTCFAREDNLFCVGDVKQSIYRFRNAEPSLFQSKFDRYGRGEGGRLVLLNSNFRSRANVLRFTNAVFEKAMYGEETEILYDERAALKPSAKYEGEDSPVELCLFDKRKSGDNVQPENDEPQNDEAEFSDSGNSSEAARIIQDMKDAEIEASIIARRIRELKGTPTYDSKKGLFRPLEYRDFVILIRQARDVASSMLAVFKQEGIPAYADVSGGYLDVVEVRLATALLQLIENRKRDVEWIAVLRSPVMGLSSEELAEIRLKRKDKDVSYWEAVTAYAAEEDNELAKRLRALCGRLDRWRERSMAMPLPQFLFEVMRESTLYACVGALPGGVQRQANLDILCDRAATYEAGQSGGLTGFLDYLGKISISRDDIGEAHVLGENDNVVRIMTAHKSKGLEFPVVFGAQLGRAFNMRSSNDEMCLHREIGAGLRHIDNRLGSERDTLPRLAAAERQVAESRAEELRILYVLLTRAKDRLVLVGSCSNMEKQMQRSAIGAQARLTPSNYLDVVLPAVLEMSGTQKLENGPIVSREGVKVDVRIMSRQDLILSENKESKKATQLFDEAAASAPDESLLAAYGWVYPHAGAVMLPRKLTASGLSRELEGPAQPPEMAERPAFMTENAGDLTGAERGTAAHTALQNLDLAALNGLKGDALHARIVQQINAMTDAGILTPAMREVIRPRMLAAFFEEGPGARMLRADELKREWMFTYKMTARDALNVDSDETVLIQGSIDCCFIENGAWILLDYKTDRSDDEDELRRRYEPQLTLYARALEKITGIPVRETLICLLRTGRVLTVERSGDE